MENQGSPFLPSAPVPPNQTEHQLDSPGALATGPVGLVLVCLMVDSEASALLEAAVGLTNQAPEQCRVLVLDTPLARYAGAAIQEETQLALDLAEQRGAILIRVSLEIHSPMHVISAIIHQAKSVRASKVIIGGHSMVRQYWPGFGERVSDFAELLASSLPQTDVHVVMPRRTRTTHAQSPNGNVIWTAGHWHSLKDASLIPLVALSVCTGVSALLAPFLHPINLTLIFLLGQVYVALHCSMRASFLTLISSILIYDGIFVEPRWSLKPTDPQYLFTLLVALLVGFAVNRLAARSRETAQRAIALAERSQSLSLLAQNLNRAKSEPEIVDAVTNAAKMGVSGVDSVSWHPATTERERIQSSSNGLLLPLRAMAQDIGALEVTGAVVANCNAEEFYLLQSFAHQMAMALERLQYERQVAQSAVEAESERIRNTLLAAISHDFRTPLTTIIGAATTVLTQGNLISIAQRDTLARNVLEQAQRLQALTNDLLDLAKLQEGAVRPQPEWCPFDELLHEALALAGSALNAHQLVVKAHEDAIVWCDGRLVTQALVNLLVNAAEHAPRGTIVEVAVVAEAHCWRLTVRDDGPGLAPGKEHEVFQKFYRERSAQAGQGTGLGLAICAAVAKLHGGEITARTDSGAVFSMTFPMSQSLACPPEAM